MNPSSALSLSLPNSVSQSHRQYFDFGLLYFSFSDQSLEFSLFADALRLYFAIPVQIGLLIVHPSLGTFELSQQCNFTFGNSR